MRLRPLLALLIPLLCCGTALQGQVLGTISTVAGQCGSPGYLPEPSQATANELGNALGGLAVDSSGNLYIADQQNNRIRMVNTSGVINTVAGNGTAGYSGDDGPATSAQLNSPAGIAVDSAGNIYFSSAGNNVIRRFTVGGTISTVAGGGATSPSLTPIAPLTAKLLNPLGLAVDKANNLLYITNNNNELLKWDLSANTIVVVVGNNLVGGITLSAPTGVAVGSGVPYIAESGGAHLISKFQGGVYSVVAGGGSTNIPASGAPVSPATNAKILQPGNLAFDSSGFLYATDNKGDQLLRIDLTNNSLQAVAGTGANGCAGDGGPALLATLQLADGLAISAHNRVYVGQDTVAVVRSMLVSGTPASVSVVSGSPQSATVATTFAAPFIVVVKDSAGNPLSGISVSFSGGGETVSPGTATTNAAGQAETTVTASTTAGTFTVTASAAGVSTPASGSFTNLAGSVATLTFAAPPSNATAGATITPAVVVKAVDTYGNPVSGITISLTLQGGTGTLSGATPQATNTSGLATFAALSVNKTGTYTLRASDGTHFVTSTSFVISPAAVASISVVAGNNQSAPVGTVYASQLKASVQDGLGNAIPGVSVTFTAPSTGPSVTFGGPSVVTTDSTGVAAVTVTANTQIGAFQVTAAAPGAGSAAIFNLDNIAGSASRLAFVQQPTNTVAGATITPAVTVQLLDSLGNNVPQSGVAVTLSLNPVLGRLRSLSGTTTVNTNAQGLAAFANLSISAAGQYQFTATGTSLTSAQSSTFTISAGAVAAIQATGGATQSATIYGPFAVPLQALVTDSSGNPISGASVTFTAPPSGASASLTAASATTDATGHASVSATANGTVGTYNVTASIAGFSATFALTNVASAGASVVFTEQPANTAAGAVMTPVVVRVTDTGGNPAAGVTISLSAQGGPGVLSGMTPTATDPAGNATFSTLSIDKAGTYSLQATDGTRFTTSTSFVISPGTAASITVVSGSGQSAPIGSFYANPLSASVQDQFGNGIPGVAVTFSAPGSGPSVTFTGSPTVTTDSTGVASISVTANAQIGSFQVTATAPGTPTPATFSLTNVAGTASHLAFVQQPSNTAAGAVIAPPITVQITDNVGNAIDLPGVSVTLSLNPVVGRLRTLSGTTIALTNASGLATFSNISISVAGSYTLTASATSLASANSNTFQILAGGASAIQAVAGTPQSATVLSPFAVPLQVLVTDAFTNPLSGVTVTFAAPPSGASATLSGSTAITDGNGHASVTATANAAVGFYDVIASVSGVTPSATFALTNLGGAGASLIFSQQPSNAAAGAIISPVVVAVTDNGGNPVSGVTISLSAQGGSGVLSGATPVATNSSGLATFSNLSIDKTGTYSLQATDGRLFANSNAFVITPGTSSSITVVAGSGQSAAVSTPYATALKASVQDAQGNGVPGVAVTFSAPASGPSVTFSGPATVSTDSTGVASISVTANTVVGSVQVTATAPGVAAPAVFSLMNIAGSASRLAFVQQPTDTLAGATMAPPVTVQITDSVGNAIAQGGVSITLALNSQAGGLRSTSGTLAITDATGLATFSSFSVSTAGTYQLTASGTALVSTQSTTFHILAAPPAAIQAVSGTPQSTTVLAPFAVPLQVLVTDSFANPLSGVTVTFTAPGSGASATRSSATPTTDANGHASVSATANAIVGSYTVTASVSGVTPSATFNLTNVGGTGSSLTFTQQPVDTPAGAVIPPVTVLATDNGGNPVSGVTIVLSAQGGPGTLSGAAPVVTDSAGLATFPNLSINKTGTYSLQATDGTRFATSNSFIIGPGTSSNITVVAGNGQSTAVGTNYVTPLKVSVQDTLGNPIPGVAVTFSAPASGPSATFLGPTTVTTDGTGVAGIFVTANSQVGSFQVTATAPGTPAPAVFSLTNVPGSASRLAFVQQPSDAAAGMVIAPPITLQLTDNLGNNVAQAGVTVTLSLNPVAGRLSSVSGTTTVQTNASGLASFGDLSISVAGSYQFTALGTSLASVQSNSFTISTGPAAAIQTVAGTPQSTTVLAPFAVPLQALVTDSFENPVGGVTVTFTAPPSGASATLSATTATTDGNGHASVSATANGTVGAYSVTAAVAGVTTPASFSLTNVGGTGSNLVFTQQPVNTAAGAIIPAVVVRLTDNGGNPVSGVTISISAQGGSGVLSGATPVATDAAGLATFSNLSLDKVGTYALQATDGTHFATSSSFVITPGTASSITVVAGSGQSAAVGTPYATALKASVQDAQGNGVPGVAVAFSAPGSGASVTFSGSSTVLTDSTGVASISATANTQVGSFQVTATAAGIATPAVFTLTNVAGTASRLSFVQQPTDTLAGAVMAPPVTVQLTDSVGNPIAQSGVTVTLSMTPVVGRLRTISGTVATTNSSGLATFSSLSISTAGTYQLTASGTSLVSAESVTFHILAGAASAIQTVAGTPQSTTVLAPFALPLQVLVTDSSNNPVSGATVTFAAPTSGASATLSAATATTDANGHATVSATANGAAGAYTVTASVTGVTASASFSLTNVGGTGSNLVFTQQPANAAAGAIIPAVVVRLTDNGGNPVSGVTISISAQGGSGVLSGATPVTTNSSGLATFSNLSIDKTGTYALQATDGTHFATSSSFVITPGTASSITVVAGSGQSAAVGTPYATALKASVQDAQGNGVPGIVVTFSAPVSGASVTFSGPVTVSTDGTGVASIAATANTQVGSFQVMATAAGIATPAVFSLTNVAGTASHLSFAQPPTDTLAGAVMNPPVTVQLTDSVGNPIAQSGVTITLSLNPIVGRLRTISGTIAATNANGLATFSSLSISTAGAYQLTASGASLVSAESATFHILAGTPAAIQTVAGTPQSTTVLAPFAVPLQVLVTDAAANPLSGVTVSFAAPASGASANLSAATATTDANGHASVTAIANAIVGSYTATASVAGVTSAASFALTNIAGTGSNLTFDLQPVSTPAGTTMPPVTVRATDNGGNPVGGLTISLAAQGGTGVLSGATPAVTNSSGLATFSNLSIDKTGTYSLQATDGTRFATSNSFVITPGTASSITVVAGSGQSAAVETPYATPLKASVQDAQGNGIAGVSVTFSAPTSGAGVTFSGSSTALTDSTGVASISVTANTQVGSFQVTAAAAGIATPAVFTLTNVAGTASHLSFVQQPTNAIAGATIVPAVTVQLTDSLGNPIAQSGVTITLSLNPAAGRLRTISGTAATTNGNGLATFSNLSVSTAGAYQLTASGVSLVSAQSNQFVISASGASRIQPIGGTPQSAAVLTAFAVPLQVLVTDTSGNAVSGASVTFTAPPSGASATLSAQSAVTDAAGHASVTATANSLVGSYTVTAATAGVTPAASFALTNISGGGALLSFTQQPVNTPAGTTIPPVAVRFTDSGGNPVSAASVTITATGGPGSLLGTLSATTDASGTATFSDLRIDVIGSYQLVAGTSGISALSAIFQIGPAAGRTITVVAGNTQSAAAGNPYAVPLQVSVQDGFGNAVPGSQVTFTPPAAGASVTFSGNPTVTTDANGLAASPIATANSQPGIFQVNAATPGAAGQATFNLQNLSAAASGMQFVQQPSDTTAGTAVTPAVTVQLVDQFGNPVAQAGVSVQLLLSSAAVVSGGITGGTVQTNPSGLAIFPNLAVAQVGTYQLLALATGFGSSASASFHIAGGSPATVTAAGGTPQSTTVLTTFSDTFVALVTDASGNPLPGISVTFTAPVSGASGTFAARSTTVTATTDVNGRAGSPVFTANNTSGTYTVTASVGLAGAQAAFALANLPPAALALAFVTQPSNAAAGTIIRPPVRVQIQDTNGQPVDLSGVTVLMTLSQGTGSLSGSYVQMTDATGIATFGDLSINLAGPKQLRAFGSAETAAQSAQFQISPGAPVQIVPVIGGSQIAAPLTEFSSPLQVRVLDASGNPVPGVAVTFTLPPSGASGTFAGSPVVQSDANGFATSPLITANNIQGVFTATASAANIADVQFPLAIVQPSGGSLQVVPTVVQFAQTFGGSAPSSQTAQITSISSAQLLWTATPSAPWLTVSPGSGTTPAQITLSVNGSALAPGQYAAVVTIADTTGDQQTLFVSFTVTGVPALVAQPSSLSFVAVVGTDLKPRSVPPKQIQLTSTNALVPITYRTAAQVQTPAGSTWLSVSPASGSTPGTITVAADTTALQPGVYSGVVTFTPDDTTISQVSVPVTLVVGCGTSGCPSPAPVGVTVTNAASFDIGGSPSAAQTIFGSYLASSTQTAASYPLPTSLAGTQVSVNGIAAPLYYVSPTQINFQMPSGTVPGSATVQVTTIAGSSSGLTPLVTPVQPGLYVSSDLRAKALNQNLTLHTPQTPIPAGGYVLLFLTGLGPTTPAVPDGQPAPTSPLAYLNGSVSAAVGGVPATVQFAGLAPGFVGLIQVNVQIPPGLSPGDQPVFVTISGTPSNAGLITVK